MDWKAVHAAMAVHQCSPLRMPLAYRVDSSVFAVDPKQWAHPPGTPRALRQGDSYNQLTANIDISSNWMVVTHVVAWFNFGVSRLLGGLPTMATDPTYPG